MQIERDDDVAGWGRCIPRKTWAERCREVHAGTRYVRKARQDDGSLGNGNEATVGRKVDGQVDSAPNGDEKHHES